MSADWLILHGGALGDLVLTMQLALRLPGIGDTETLRIISRTNPGDLSTCRPHIARQSSEGLGLHWLFSDHDDPPPERLRQAVRGAHVLSALGGVQTIPHQRLAALEPAALYSIEPQPPDGEARHIVQQWQTQLEEQGVLVPKCIHQHPAQRGLGVPDALRRRGDTLLGRCFGERRPVAPAPGSDWDRPVVVVHPGSGGRGKCWPLPGFVQVARQLRQEPRVNVCFVVGHVELETWSPAELDTLAAEFPVLHGPPPDELAATLTATSVLVGNDAGPVHLAALLGTPTVTIFGPTAASVWRPLGIGAHVITGSPGAEPDTWGIDPAQVVSLVLKCL
jgi:hypothetical protein